MCLTPEQFVDGAEELQPHAPECLGDFGACPAPAWAPLGAAQSVFLLSPLETGPWQSHGKGFPSPGKHVPGEQSWRQFPPSWERTGGLALSSVCRELL